MPSTRQSGFTLLELMIVVAIAAVGLGLGLPAFTDTIRANRVAAASNTLIGAFNLARTEAIRSNRGSAVCSSTAGDTCDGSGWNSGMLVFSDNDASGAWSAGDTAVRFFERNSSVQFTSTGSNIVLFDRRGRTTTDLEFTLKPSTCKAGAAQKRRLYVKSSGQVRVTKETC